MIIELYPGESVKLNLADGEKVTILHEDDANFSVNIKEVVEYKQPKPEIIKVGYIILK